MLVIRLARTGRKNAATFRLVLQEKTQAPKSKSLETLGSYHPHLQDRAQQIQLDAERIQYWLSKGAQPSATVYNMLVEAGVVTGAKRKVVRATKKVEEAAEVPAEEAKPEATTAPEEAAPAEEKTEEAAA